MPICECGFKSSNDLGSHGPMVRGRGFLDLGFKALGDTQTEVEVISSHGAQMTQNRFDRYATHMPHLCQPQGAALEGAMAEVRMSVRLPIDVAEFLARMARENFTSRNAEVIRSIRERMKRLQSGSDDPAE